MYALTSKCVNIVQASEVRQWTHWDATRKTILNITSPFNRWVSLQFIFTLSVRGLENVLPSEFNPHSTSRAELAIRESKSKFNKLFKFVILALKISFEASTTIGDDEDLELIRINNTREESKTIKLFNTFFKLNPNDIAA